MPINYKYYSKDYKLRSKFVIHIRAKNKCEFCNIENGTNFPGKNSIVRLACIHKYFDLKFNSLLDLASACNVCHLKHDKNNNSIRRKYKIHKIKQLVLF